MRRLAKPAGRYNLAFEEVAIPEPGPTEVRVKAVRSLISRGSEIGRRYTREEAIDPQMMGYSMSGIVDAVGESVSHIGVGDRVVISAPHADYVVRDAIMRSDDDRPLVYPIDPAVDYDAAPYWSLVSGCVTWAAGEEAEPTDTIVIVGQGLVGSLLLQVHKANGIRRVVAIDALDMRCELADKLGADVVINAAHEDPVQAVHKLTSGLGAEIVVYAVGGPAGPKAFDQSLDMLARGGLLHLVGRYEDAPLPFWSHKFAGKRMFEGYYPRTKRMAEAKRGMDLLATGTIKTDLMTTHRFSFNDAPAAFDLLHRRAGETLGVLLDWTLDDA